MRTSLALFLFLAGCAKPNYVTTVNGGTGAGSGEKATVCAAKMAGQSCVSLSWEVMPTETGFGSFVFKIYRPNLFDGTTVVQDLNGDLTVVLWMPGMGHGSSPVTVERLDVGTYRASKVFFTMRGEWQIRVQLKVRNEIRDEAIIPITF